MSFAIKVRHALALALATVAGNLYLVVGSLFFATLTGILGWMLPPRRVFRFLARWWSRTVLWTSGVTLDREIDEPLLADQRYVLMANHESLYDIPVLLATLPVEARFLAKQSLFRIPLFGWSLRVGGFIPVDRVDRSTARRTFLRAIDELESGISILLFPEESRTLDGELQEFRRGGFLLALRSGLPIVPVGIEGAWEVRPRGRWLIRPGRVKVHYGRSVSSSGRNLRDMGRFIAEVREEIRRLTQADPEREKGLPSHGS